MMNSDEESDLKLKKIILFIVQSQIDKSVERVSLE